MSDGMNADQEQARMRAIAENQPPFARHIGFRLVSAERNRVVGEITVGMEHSNRNGVLHGGAVMAFADNLGGTASFMHLPEGTSTSTIESKTNFFAGIRVGEVARGECTPLHLGRSTMVWQTRITRPDGKLAALVTQTQMVLKG
jgi:1,4-dihydroxy-2-naphthoyl-CoA hydrolase